MKHLLKTDELRELTITQSRKEEAGQPAARANRGRRQDGAARLYSAIMAAALTLTAGLTACDTGGGEDGNSNNTEDQTKKTDVAVDWADHSNGDYSIKVSNQSNNDLVAFKNSLSTANLVGGVKKKEQNFGLKKGDSLFTKTEDFVMVFITNEQYEKNKSNLSALDEKPFTRVYAFFNKDSINESVYEISASLGGDYKLSIQNGTQMNVELRLNGVNGQPLAYARNSMFNTEISLGQGDYLVFPVFRKYIESRKEIITVYPRYAANKKPKNVLITLDGNDKEQEIDVSDYIAGIELSTGSAYLNILNNATGGGAVQLRIGDTLQKTSTGTSGIKVGESRLFQIDMDKLGGSAENKDNLADSKDAGGYSIGNATAKTLLSTLTTHVFDVDYAYTITVTRDANTGDFILSEPVKSQNKVSLND